MKAMIITMKIRLPYEYPDIQKKIQTKTSASVFRIVIGLLLVAALECLCFLYYGDKNDSSLIAVYLIIALLAFRPVKELIQLLLDFSWEGTICEINYKEYYDGSMKTKCRNYGRLSKDGCILHTMQLQIKMANHKTVVKDLLWDNPKQLLPYRVGDNVRYYRGTKYPLIIDDKQPRPLCILCGCTTISETGHCEFCGTSIIQIHAL